MTDRELMQQALEAFKLIDNERPTPVARLAMKNLRERLAQPERQWQGLTEPEIHELDWPEDVSFEDILPFVRAIEAKIKEKNGG